MASIQTPSKPCHNCRRQRLRCDRSYPYCHKCTTAGKTCLGYGQLFRWTGAVASRGKLAGQTTTADVCNVPRSSPIPCAGSSSRVESRSEDDASSGEYRETAPGEDRLMRMVPWQPKARFNQDGICAPGAPRVLIDPLFQDLSHTYRYYLSYFVSRLCKDLVSYDLPDHNPFRRLVPLTRAHPLLQHVVVAASAAHMSNLMRPPLPASPRHEMSSASQGSVDASRQALRDSLLAKQKALQLMHTALQDVDVMDGDVVLAAALFFVNVELIESGKHGWKAHLEGAGKIISLLQPTDNANEALRDYMLSDCFSYFILGSTLAPLTSAGPSNFQASQIHLILQRAASNSYLCCPPEILEILYAASQLSNVETHDEDASEDVALAGMELLRRAQSFEIEPWANSIHVFASFYDIPVQGRIHAGSAHRLAACLYIVQAMPFVTILVSDEAIDNLSGALFEHLECIPDDDPNFKATTWPTFIAGAGARDQAKRDWVLDRLHRLVLCCPWGFLYTAMETLQVIWDLKREGKGQKSWVQMLKDSGEEFLIV